MVSTVPKVNLHPKEVAFISGVGLTRVYKALKSGELPSRTYGRSRLIHVDDAATWASQLGDPE